MNTPLKRGMQILGVCAILGTSACVVDPYYSGVDYDGYSYDNNRTSSTTIIGTGSNFSYNSGFLVGNYYYLDDYYYPISYYNNGGNRYYRPDFGNGYRYHPDNRYRNLSRLQLEQWRRNQHDRFDPSYRPNRPNNQWHDRDNDRWNNRPNRPNRPNDNHWNNNNNRPSVSTPSRPPVVTRPTPSRPPISRPTPSRPQVQPPIMRPSPSRPPISRPTPSQPQVQPSRPTTRPITSRPPVQQIQQQQWNNAPRPVVQPRGQTQMQPRFGSMDGRRMNER